jgi:RNA polymerase sigma-70 factor (ECF subfamily)
MKEGTLDLIRRAQQGDHAAFDELVEKYAPDLYRLALAVVGPDAAADVTQDAFLRAWADVRSLRDPDRFGQWLRRILVNRCRDLVRARQRVRILSLDTGTVIGAPMSPDPATAADQSVDLHRALKAMTLDQRLILALHYLADLPIRDVAQVLAVPEGTAKSRLHSAMQELRRTMGEES